MLDIIACLTHMTANTQNPEQKFNYRKGKYDLFEPPTLQLK